MAITKLKAIHAATHPAARLERKVEVREEPNPRAALLADLAAEAEEEEGRRAPWTGQMGRVNRRK